MARGIVGERGGGSTTEYTEWKRPLSGAHSITMEKFAQAGEDGGCTHAHPLSLYLPSFTRFWCTLQVRGQIHPLPPLLLFLLYHYMYSVGLKSTEQ